MMKKILFTMLVLLTATIAFAQSNFQDVVYLYDGSIIRGKIVDSESHESVKIEVAGGNLLVLKLKDIQKMVKERVEAQTQNTSSSQSPQRENQPALQQNTTVSQPTQQEQNWQRSGNVESQNSEYQLSNNCALLHLYRPKTMKGAAISYNVHLDNEMIFRMKNNSATTVRVTSEGRKILWAKTETKAELPINIQFGHEYYVRCSVKFGALIGRPKLEFVDSNEGKFQIAKISQESGGTQIQNTQVTSQYAQTTSQNAVSSNENYGVERFEKEFKNFFRFAVSGIMDMNSIDLQYARYITPDLAIPVDLAYCIDGYGGGFVLTGIETVLFPYRQKSGLFYSALAGIVYDGDEAGFMANTNVGFQHVTKKGFTFSIALGPVYETIYEEFNLRAIFSVGYAF